MSEQKLKTCRRGHTYIPRTKDCPECQAIRARKWYDENLALCKLRDRARHLGRQGTDYYKVTPSYMYTPAKKQYLKEYAEKNKARLNAEAARRAREARQECPIFKLKDQTRTILYQVLTRMGTRRKKSTEDMLGCSYEFFREHMWNTAINRYGFWSKEKSYHIDHIIPLATARSEEDIIKLSHYTNLQLLYPEDNIKKGANHETSFCRTI